LVDVSLALGRILVAQEANNRIVELDAKGNQTWASETGDVPGAFGCQGLPDGHRLVVSLRNSSAVEFDAQGKIVWRTEGRLPVYPYAVQRLGNGNTLVAGQVYGRGGGLVVEIGRDGKPVAGREIALAGPPRDARRLDNGHTLVTFAEFRRVVEYDAAGNPIDRATIDNLGNPQTARRLPNGNTLVVDRSPRVGPIRGAGDPGRVLEFNAKGEIVWQSNNGFVSLTDAERLENGHTLVLDGRGIHEVDEKGTVVWSKEVPGCRRMSAF
jgi:DNA-binding beta-propeller fold protein YncE